MSRNQILIAFTVVFLSFSCKKDKPVTACIELSSASISAGSSIDFTSCSENEWSYLWSIAGPATAAENDKGWSDRIFSNTFDTPGDYTVTLKAYSDFSFLGESKTTTTSFKVN